MRFLLASGLALVVAVVLSLESHHSGVSGGLRPGVEVLTETQAGIFDVRVVRSDSEDALLEWLAGNGFRFGEEDRSAVGDYVERGWCFVTARITPGTREIHGERTMVLPLALSFATPQPVYPLALTGTIGSPTEVLLYVTASSRVEADRRFQVRYAGPVTRHWGGIGSGWFREAVTPEDFLRHVPEGGDHFLTVLRGRLPPSAMKTDLVLEETGGRKPLRRTKFVW